MLITLIDVETTGLSPNTAEVAEVGAILFDTEAVETLQQVSTLLPIKDNPAEYINGISPELTRLIASDMQREAILMIEVMLYHSQYTMAYNSRFDKPFVERLLESKVELDWIDAMLLPWQHYKVQPSLVDLCLAYGVPVVSAHRALDDCRLLAALLGKLPNIDYAIAYALEPRVIIKALIGYDDRQLAKDEGFSFNRFVPNAWAKQVRRSEVEGLDLPFEFGVVETSI